MRVRLIFPGALGDFLLLAPAAATLAAAGHDVELSVQRALGDVARRLFTLGPPADGTAMSTLFTTALDPAVRSWLQGADRVHAWLGHAGSAALARHAGGLAIGELRSHTVVRGEGSRHASVDYAVALGVDPRLASVRLPIDPADAEGWWRAPCPRRLIVHPGAGSADKRWSQTGFRSVANCWRAAGGEVIVLLGPAEGDLVEFWLGAEHRSARDLELCAAARLIASSPRYLGNDSGISHLSGALGRRGVVLYGPTRAERWRPLGGRLVAVDMSSDSESRLANIIAACLGDS